MDYKTKQYYSTHVQDASNLYNSAKTGGVSRYFRSAFIAGSAVLDIGAGSGRDMVILASMGYDVYGIDASPEMAEYIAQNVPSMKDRIKCASLPTDELFFNIKFDSVLCSAMLMHIGDDQLFDTAYCIRNNLKENGRLLVSVPVKRDDLDSESRTPDGRLFIIRSFDYYTLLFERLGFKQIGYYEDGDSLGREGVLWGVGVFEVV